MRRLSAHILQQIRYRVAEYFQEKSISPHHMNDFKRTWLTYSIADKGGKMNRAEHKLNVT